MKKKSRSKKLGKHALVWALVWRNHVKQIFDQSERGER